MEHKFTPGPWAAKEYSSPRGSFYVEAANGRFLRVGEAEANARLIAAAPELYEACKAAFHSLKSYEYGNASPDVAIEAAKFVEAAISKAEGRA